MRNRKASLAHFPTTERAIDAYRAPPHLYPEAPGEPTGSLSPPARGLLEEAAVVTRIEEAEEAAEEFRQRWELGKDPIENLAGTLEDRGVKVLLMDAPDGFDGLACWANGDIPVVVANAGKNWDRQRFDLGHELGELVLDPTPDVDSEMAAHRFSGAFLVPAEVVRHELGPNVPRSTPKNCCCSR